MLAHHEQKITEYAQVTGNKYIMQYSELVTQPAKALQRLQSSKTRRTAPQGHCPLLLRATAQEQSHSAFGTAAAHYGFTGLTVRRSFLL
jgi:adenine deaminase